MGKMSANDRATLYAKALDNVLRAYQDDIKGIMFAELTLDSLPVSWWVSHVIDRGPPMGHTDRTSAIRHTGDC